MVGLSECWTAAFQASRVGSRSVNGRAFTLTDEPMDSAAGPREDLSNRDLAGRVRSGRRVVRQRAGRDFA